MFLLTLANRDLSRSLLARNAAKNPWVPRMFGGVVAMLAVVISVPFFRHVMGLAVPNAAALAFAPLMLAVSIVWLEGLRRMVWRFRHSLAGSG